MSATVVGTAHKPGIPATQTLSCRRRDPHNALQSLDLDTRPGNPAHRDLVTPLLPARPASAGDVRHGVADLDPAETPGWREFKTLWFSAPAYQGPFVIRAERLDKHGPIRLGGSGALPTSATPIVVPSGPTLNSWNGWRTVPSGTWARAPGCYAWQVDGITFSEIIVVRAAWFRSEALSP